MIDHETCAIERSQEGVQLDDTHMTHVQSRAHRGRSAVDDRPLHLPSEVTEEGVQYMIDHETCADTEVTEEGVQ